MGNKIRDNIIGENMEKYIFSYENMEPVFRALIPILLTDSSVIISIDGRSGSGKSGMALMLREIFSCNVFHMDDYYLPFDKREEGWEQEIAGNMDLGRILREVLIPASQGKDIMHRPYDSHSGCFKKEELLPPHKLTVVEGSYSQHPMLAAQYTLKIFLTCSKEVQSKRLMEREGTNYAAFESRWIPMEENYIRSCRIEEQSDLVLDSE